MPVSSECAIEALGYDESILPACSETIDLFGGALEEIRHPLGRRASQTKSADRSRQSAAASSSSASHAAPSPRCRSETKETPIRSTTLSQGSVSASFGRTPLSRIVRSTRRVSAERNSAGAPGNARTHMDKRALVGKDSHPASLANVEERPRAAQGALHKRVCLLVPQRTRTLRRVSRQRLQRARRRALTPRYLARSLTASSRTEPTSPRPKPNRYRENASSAPISSQPSAKPIVSPHIFPHPRSLLAKRRAPHPSDTRLTYRLPDAGAYFK